jgi:uncharacterized membrane protein HdeD (DUF308 family)
MVASAIAYALTTIFAVIGVLGLVVTYRDRKKDGPAGNLFASTFFLALAWLCAYLGGI